MDLSAKDSKHISWKVAKALGLKRYFTGKPCKTAGHIDERFVTNRACVVCIGKGSNNYDRANPDKLRERARRWREKNPERARHIKNARTARIRSQATTDWDQREAILVFYWMAEVMTKRLKIKHHIDHIYPLNGKTSCGLHIPINLQILPRLMNLRKANKMPKQKDCQIKLDQHTVALLERGKINGRHEIE